VDIVRLIIVERLHISDKTIVNSHCFRSVVKKLKWKSSNNKFRHENKDPVYRYFSDAAVEEFIKKVIENDGYLERARKSYSNNSK
jgi:P pilus assembly chaperone PapD